MGEHYDLDRDDRGLTVKEREVEALLAEGLSPSEIAGRLGLTRQRVWQLRKSIESKMATVDEEAD